MVNNINEKKFGRAGGRAPRRCSGQAMILTVLALGGTMLGATTIAGLLMIYQLRQATDLGNSAKAIFAADTGIEWGLYQIVKPDGSATAPIMRNGAAFSLVCYDDSGASVECQNGAVASIQSVGTAGGVSRAFQASFVQQ